MTNNMKSITNVKSYIEKPYMQLDISNDKNNMNAIVSKIINNILTIIGSAFVSSYDGFKLLGDVLNLMLSPILKSVYVTGSTSK